MELPDIVNLVKKELTKPEKIWENYVPILKDSEQKSLTVYLTEPIHAPGVYNEACYELSTTPADWNVKLILSTPGGYASSAFNLLDAMKKCKAPIHGFITGSVASAGTIVAMGCDTIEMSDYSEFMCHNYSHGTEGSGAQVKEYVNFTDREFTAAAKEIYAGFLSEAEISSISEQDKEIWLNKTEVLSRWPNKQFRSEAVND